MKFLIILAALTAALHAKPTVKEGEIEGANYTILVPERPSGKVLLLAHGYRPVENPLSSGFGKVSEFSTALTEDGWVIASTSYRRNGWIIDDALADLRALQAKVTELCGESKQTIILGNSMGGQIATLAAEGALAIEGAVAIGCALQDYPKKELSPQLSFAPRVPLILLINQETNRPMSVKYQERAGEEFTALWKVERPGHCNVSDSEKLLAVRGVESWLAGKEVARMKDATVPVPDLPSTAETSLIGKVNHLNRSWGNITSSFVRADLETLGVSDGEEIVVASGEREYVLTLVQHYSLLPQGRGAAFIDPDGFLTLQINRGNLGKELGAGLDDRLRIARKLDTGADK